MNRLVINKVANGYILGEANRDESLATVIEDEEESTEGVIKLLTEVAAWTGYTYDKFGDKNLNISFDKKGHKL